jgi:1,2-diacylglycerol 3-beta-galactosyltransferase
VNDASSKPKLFFATIAAGGGHVATAKAMIEAIERHYPDQFELVMSDFMLELGFFREDKRHKDGWRWALEHAWAARAGQRLIDNLPRLTVMVHRRMLDGVARKAAEAFAEPPKLIVSNHPWLTVALTKSQRRYGLKAPVLTFATEVLDASALWADPDAEHVVAPSLAAMNDLVRMGVSPARIDVVGYPVGQAFLRALPKGEARKALGLADRFTCLVSLGGEGRGGNTVKLTRDLLVALKDVQLVVIAGRNESLRRELVELAEPGTLRVEGFVDNMASYLSAADVVVGKAGPASVFEALAVGRPVLVTSYAGLNERKIVAFLERKSLGSYLPQTAALIEKIVELKAHPQALEAFAGRARALDIAGATESLAHYVVAYSQTGAPSARLRGGLA